MTHACRSSRITHKQPNPDNSTRYATCTCSRIREDREESDLCLHCIGILLLPVIADTNLFSFVIDEIVQCLDHLDVEPPDYVGWLPPVTALLHPVGQAAPRS